MTFDDLKHYAFIYVASPYRRYPQGIGAAASNISKITARLQLCGISAWSPIAHGHMMTIHGGIHPSANELWMKINAPLMAVSDAMLIAKMDSWETSDGIAEEIKIFRGAGKPIFELDPATYTIAEHVVRAAA